MVALRLNRRAVVRVLGALALVLATTSVTAATQAASPGLVAAYSFNEGAGTAASDSSGSGNPGTISGAVWTSSGKFGGALVFDGVNDSVTVADSNSLDLTGGLTLEAWVKQDSGGSGWHTAILKERPGGLAYALYSKTSASGPSGHIQVGSTQARARYGTQLVNGVWNHVAATYDGAAVRVYVNGAQVVTQSQTGLVSVSAGLLRIGGNSIWSEWFKGTLDEVRIYNRALGVSEIQSDMATPIGPADTVAPTAPTNLAQTGATENSVTLSWTASTDDVGVADYTLYNGTTPTGTVSTTQGTIGGLACGTSYSAGVDARDAASNRSAITYRTASTAACDTTPPAIQLTAPAAGSAVSGTVRITATASDNTGVAGVRFRVDGNAVASEDTAAPYAVDWDSATVPNGQHSITAVARDTSGNTTTSAPVTVNVFQQVPNFTNETVVSGLNEPTDLVFAPDGRLFISERTGKIKVVQPGASAAGSAPLIDVPSIYAVTDERGILAIALDPQFATNGYLYVHYTHSSLKNRVSRFTVAGGSADPLSELVLWQNDRESAIYHSGGRIAFGPDGYLYIAVGDRLDPQSAQSLSTYTGKILRIAKDGSVPANPFYDGSGPNREEIWAYGLRNPWRFSFDSLTGRMYIGDVGQNDVEEINLGEGGKNYGWPTCEGPCARTGLTDPIYSYDHNGGDASITAGFVYRGGNFPSEFQGTFFYADYVKKWIKRLTFDGAGVVTGSVNFEAAGGSFGNIVSMVQGPDGAVYYVDIGPFQNPNTGAVRRIRNTTANQAPVSQVSADRVSGPPPLTVNFSSAGSQDPEGQPLSYSWDFGDGASSGEANPSHTYTADGPYAARLSLSDGVNTTVSEPIQISVGNGPTAVIQTPTNGSGFRAGQTITFTGSATDQEDGQLAGGNLSWKVVFLHETHQHPAAGPILGSSGSFTVPTSGHEFAGNTRYEIALTATDSDGLKTTTSVIVYPEKVDLTFQSNPGEATITVDGITRSAPFVLNTLVGFEHSLTTPSPQQLNAGPYRFASWSDGGARTHTLTVPGADQTYTATFEPDSTAPGLVAAYHFNEGTGTALGDISGNGNSGVLSGANWTAAGKYGGALSFDGVNDWVTVGDSASLDLATGMTLEAWVRPTGGSTWKTVVIKEQSNALVYALYGSTSSQGKASGHAFVNGTDTRTYGTVLPLGAWTHLAATFDGSTIRLFVGGTQVSQVAASGAMPGSTGVLRLGGNAIWNEWFQGQIDEVRIYNRPLTAAEIQADLAAPL